MERPRGAVDEARDAKLNRLGCVLLLARLGKPLRVPLRPAEPEALLFEQQGWLKPAVRGAKKFRLRVDLSDDRLYLATPFVVQEIDLVDEQHIGKLNLVNQKVRDGPAIPLSSLPATGYERVQAAKLLEESGRVDDGDEVGEACHVAQARTRGPVSESERLGDRQWLRNARRLDNNVVEAALGSEGGEGSEKILTQRAADAAVESSTICSCCCSTPP